MDRDALIQKIRTLPRTPGVYLMKDARGRVIYVGKAVNLRSRVSQYFQPSADLGPKKARMIAEVVDVEFVPTESEVDAVLTEARLIKDIHPRYNVRLTDDKSFPYLEITTSEPFPGVYFTRAPAPKGTKLYGPFPSAAALRSAIGELQKVFRFRTCRLPIDPDDPRRRYARPCILHAIGRCTAPCAGYIDQPTYRKDIARLRHFLEGKRTRLVRELTREMHALAKALRFEEAARVRDQLRAIEALGRRGRLADNLQPEVFAPTFDPADGLKALADLLESDRPLRAVEGVDIANLGPDEAVGAVVPFLDGRPFKPGYRRFRIKTVAGPNDPAMVGEVVFRRFRRLREAMSVPPDVLLIDGGPAQLRAAARAVEAALAEDAGEATTGKATGDAPGSPASDEPPPSAAEPATAPPAESPAGPADRPHREPAPAVRPPFILSLAKRREEVYILGRAESEPLRLPRTSPALKLLQAVRDEAHRFAQHYHHLLRRKALFGEAQRELDRRRRRSSPAGKTDAVPPARRRRRKRPSTPSEEDEAPAAD